MSLGHGQANQVEGKPSKSSLGPATVSLGTSIVNTSDNLVEVGGSEITLGQTTMADSFPVVIASNQSSVSVTIDNIPSGIVSGTTSTTGTSSVELVAAVSGKAIYVFSYSLGNASNTADTISFQDGSGGTTLWEVEVPLTGTNNLAGSIPLFKTSTGNGLYFTCSSGLTTIYANASGIAQ